MKQVINIPLLITLFTVISVSLHAQNYPDEEEWIQIFNGRDLDGWQPKFKGYELNDNYLNTFRVEDGILSVKYDNWPSAFDGQFGHLFYKDKFSHYILKAEYRFVRDQVNGGPGWAFRNNGLMLHGQSAESMGKDQDFPISIEVQLLGGNGKYERSTVNLCTPGTNVVMDGKLRTAHCFNSTSKTFHGDQWVTAEVKLLGDSLTHFVNGEQVMAYGGAQIGGGVVSGYDESVKVDGKLLSDGGYISIQAETHPTDFRKIEVLNLEGCMDKNAKNYKSYYVKADNTKCKF
ncbi:MAG: DUF1080 domain-containing protein [Bacteroidetes bacterium]|nr:DUF1080 domain-containing protein [Bacteroidota bacterium]MDA1121204.1 DUF1080 domain-containing protein [Bacteroidota bacterium]